MGIKTRNAQIAAETRAIQKVSQVLDEFAPPAQRRILNFVSDAIDGPGDEPVEFPISATINGAE